MWPNSLLVPEWLDDRNTEKFALDLWSRRVPYFWAGQPYEQTTNQMEAGGNMVWLLELARQYVKRDGLPQKKSTTFDAWGSATFLGMRFSALHPKPCKARFFGHSQTRWKNNSQNVPQVQEIRKWIGHIGSPAPCFIFQLFFGVPFGSTPAWTTTLALFHEGFVIISYCTAPYVAYGWTMNELLVGTPGWVKVCVKFGCHWLYSLYSSVPKWWYWKNLIDDK